MNPFWKQQARRINALSLRERAIMFISGVVALGAVADALVLSPQISAQKAMATQLRQQTTELDGLRAQATSAQQALTADTPQARLQRTLAETRAQRQAVEAEVQRRSSVEGGAARLPELLERVLRRHERLTLRRLATAAPPTTTPDPAARTTAAATAAPAPEGGATALPMQGVDLEVSGSYADLAQYLADIERSMPSLRWSTLQLSSLTQPPVLKVRVYLHTEPGDRP